jgi:adenosylmethionine---8-amino-7-oxononanoate aminotransferase
MPPTLPAGRPRLAAERAGPQWTAAAQWSRIGAVEPETTGDPQAPGDPQATGDPGTAASWVARDAGAVWHGFTQMAAYADNAPLIIERAEGRELIDVDGRRYLDAISSLWVNTLGHRVPELDAALVEQVGKIAHSTMLGHGNVVVVELAEALRDVVPVDDAHVLFAADGAVAVEQALKIAFQYWVNRGEPGRHRFLALGDAYHGDTVGALSIGDGGVFSAAFDPLCFPVLRTPGYADPGWAAKARAAIAAHAGELAAVVIEPLVQGASGMWCAEPDDVASLGDACRDVGVLLICDEVATGFGRTGTLFASSRCELRPDLLCLGKGITGGYLPMSATVASGRVYREFLGDDLGPQTFFHGHSYGGNALAAAVALRHLQLVEEWDVLANVNRRSAQLAALLAEKVAPHPAVADVRQRGLMVGIELTPPTGGLRWGRRVSAAAVARGVLLRPLGDVIVLVPPLTITAGEVYRLVDVVEAALDDVTAPDARDPGADW